MGKKSKRNKTKPGSAAARQVPAARPDASAITRGGISIPSSLDIGAQVQDRVVFGNESMADVVSDLFPGLPESRKQALARDLASDVFDQPATRFDIEQAIAKSMAAGIMDSKVAALFRQTALENPQLSRAELAILCGKKADGLDDEADRIVTIIGDICSDYLIARRVEQDFNSAAKFALNGLDIPRDKTLLCENGEGYRVVFLVWLVGAIAKGRSASALTDDVKDRAYDSALGVSDCEEEPMMARSLAMMVRFELVSGYLSRECTYLKRALVYASQVPDDTLTEPVVLPCSKGSPGTSVPVKLSVRDIFDECLVTCRSTLCRFQGPPTSTLKRLSEGWRTLEVMDMYGIAAGGSRCDVCNKLPENVGLIALHKCKRCRLAFYCSKECQEEAWKDHASHCKKWNCFKEGDHVVLQGLRKRADLNESIVRIIEKVSVAATAAEPNGSKRWKVELVRSSQSKKNTFFTIKPENCRHLRPLA